MKSPWGKWAWPHPLFFSFAHDINMISTRVHAPAYPKHTPPKILGSCGSPKIHVARLHTLHGDHMKGCASTWHSHDLNIHSAWKISMWISCGSVLPKTRSKGGKYQAEPLFYAQSFYRGLVSNQCNIFKALNVSLGRNTLHVIGRVASVSWKVVFWPLNFLVSSNLQSFICRHQKKSIIPCQTTLHFFITNLFLQRWKSI